MWNDGRISRLFIGVSFVLRLVYIIRCSYLHPDEHLQGPQEIVHGSFGWASQTPWEFTTENPLRSFVPLMLIYGIPTGFFSADTDPVYILFLLRFIFALFTWILEDMAVERLAATRNDKLRTLFFVSTSYVTLTWQAHTLSNSFETILVLWCLVILYEAEAHSKLAFQGSFDRHYDSFLIAVIIVLGIFNRPTFIAFLLLPCMSLLKLWYRFPLNFFTFAFAFALTSACCIYVDTFLYGDQHGWVITPLNFVKYNLSTENLGEHGLHPRITHVLVNLPQLLGPGLLLLRPKWSSLPMLTTISALAVLSIFPHQEARFLLPLAPLLCSQMDIDQFSSVKLRKVMLGLWIAFNIILGLIMGVFHQAGVIPAQVRIRELEKPATVLWWKTYTPPLWLTGLQSDQVKYAELSPFGQTLSDIETIIQDAGSEANVKPLTEIDLQGADIKVLQDLLVQIPKDTRNFYLVAPIAFSNTISNLFNADAKPIWKTFYHLDPTLLNPSDLSSFTLGLGIWNITTPSLI